MRQDMDDILDLNDDSDLEPDLLEKNPQYRDVDKLEADFEELNMLIEDDELLGDHSASRRRNRERRERERRSGIREALSWVFTLGCAVLVALFLKNFVIINATVPTGSMENTIMPGDDLLGFRLAYIFSEPERGDIVIFRFPDDESQKFVKRIIGMPGDRVTICNGGVYLNGSSEPIQELYLKEEWLKGAGPYVFDVPEDCYFVMGDNRNDSYDSRYWQNTYVSRDQIIGKAELVYFPFKHFKVLD